jgi:hypothetical protein
MLLLPVAAPWPEDVGSQDHEAFGLPPQPPSKTLYYRPYPGRPTNEPQLAWDVTRRTLQRRDDDGLWTQQPPTSAPQFIGICIHGRKDACCGTRGGAFMRRMQELTPDAPVFGVSHLGGDRFSVNAVVLPSGYLLGRVDDLNDEALLDLVELGTLPAGHVRGRLGATPAEAVAELWYRERFSQWDPGHRPAATIVSQLESALDRYEALVVDGDRRFRLGLSREQQEGVPIHYTCAAAAPNPVYRWDVWQFDEARARVQPPRGHCCRP